MDKLYSELSFIELTSDLGEEMGYADEPEFVEHVWPVFLRNSDAVERVFLYINRAWTGSKRSFQAGERVSANIADIGPMERLSKNQFEEIEYRSFFGGHMNVLYQIAITSDLLLQVLNLYPNARMPIKQEGATFGLRYENERSELKTFIRSIPDTHVLASFAHDADPLYIFGSAASLKNLPLPIQMLEIPS